MNEFERKLLDTVQFSSWIASFADPARQVVGVEAYAYTLDKIAVAITSADQQSFDLVMDSDSDFVCTYMSGAARITLPVIVAPANGNQVTEFSPSLLIQVTDQSSSKTWFSGPTPLSLVCGAGGFPFILSSPRIVRPRSTLSVSAQGAVSGATFADFFFAFHGAKIFYAGPTP